MFSCDARSPTGSRLITRHRRPVDITWYPLEVRSRPVHLGPADQTFGERARRAPPTPRKASSPCQRLHPQGPPARHASPVHLKLGHALYITDVEAMTNEATTPAVVAGCSAISCRCLSILDTAQHDLLHVTTAQAILLQYPQLLALRSVSSNRAVMAMLHQEIPASLAPVLLKGSQVDLGQVRRRLVEVQNAAKRLAGLTSRLTGLLSAHVTRTHVCLSFDAERGLDSVCEMECWPLRKTLYRLACLLTFAQAKTTLWRDSSGLEVAQAA
ncbi:MAG: uncharacterized protein KVP18_003233 [Porospora cf. gigantea A]|uniref:uncharacterized protein n=1 Tax=Porospora cf. gigantea A TaxID=2853593 RepID=UPI0035597CC5|nr:MAG: hypothetical protein KVP18_003233 [Porospora cf. gigantea A]